MGRSEIKADMDVAKITIQASVAFLFVMMLQVITEKIGVEIYIGLTAFALAMMALSIKI